MSLLTRWGHIVLRPLCEAQSLSNQSHAWKNFLSANLIQSFCLPDLFEQV